MPTYPRTSTVTEINKTPTSIRLLNEKKTPAGVRKGTISWIDFPLAITITHRAYIP